MITLFEYGKWEEAGDLQKLKSLLKNIWSDRFDEEKMEGHDDHYQPFLQFDDGKIRANNYIGFIQHQNELIEIYPKVFRDLENPSKNLMLNHIFYWFTYCRKWKFPFSQASLDNREIDEFPELVIHLMAKQFYETVTEQPLMQYQPVEEALLSPRGSINFNRYISNSLTRGFDHLVECDHEPFLYDNLVNRVIKYCSRLLLNQTRFSDNQKLLQDVIFVLDEVDDLPATVASVDAITINSFYEDYRLVQDMCRSVINQNIYSYSSYDTSQWCMLLPMEYIFEDFVAGFLETHFSNQWKVEYQKSDAYLVTAPEEVFQMQHDIFLTSRDELKRKIIIDTKYKLRDYSYPKKQGVSQSDLYQVVSYSYRRGCTEVMLIYPNVSEQTKELTEFYIPSGFENGGVIKVTAVEIPFWSFQNFARLTENLKTQLETLLK